VQTSGSRMSLFMNFARRAEMAASAPNIWTKKMYTSSANCLIVMHI
jgi:hypothetical protein